MPDDDYPPFDEAVERFREFARREHIPDDVVFVASDDVVLRNGIAYLNLRGPHESRLRAARSYEQSASRRLGVLLEAFSRLGERICVYTYGPTDSDEAERLMYPSGLKLSIRQPLLPARSVSRARWFTLQIGETQRSIRDRAEFFK